MSRFPETVRPGACVFEAAARMKAFDLGFLPVVAGDEVVGVVTDRDLVVRALVDGRDPRHIAVSDVMTTDIVCCGDDAPLDTVARTMVVLEVRRIVVVGPGRQLLGVIGLADLTRAGHAGVAALVLGVLSRSIPGLPPELTQRF